MTNEERDLARTKLLIEKANRQAEVDGIKGQLSEAARAWHEDGVSTDFSWKNRAEAALRAKNRAVQEINRQIGDLRRLNTQGHSFQHRFYEAAVVLLSADAINNIKELAETLPGGSGHGVRG